MKPVAEIVYYDIQDDETKFKEFYNYESLGKWLADNLEYIEIDSLTQFED